jgi:sulfite reductase subunit B
MAIRAKQPESLYLPDLAEVIRAEQLTELEKFLELRLENGDRLGHKPGQFVAVSAFGVGEAPFSVSSSPTKEDGFELCIRNAGNVTSVIHKLEPGALVGIRGPFGNGFPLDMLRGRDILFVAGGLGLVPMRSLINYVLDNRDDYGKLTILYGCKNPAELLFKDELERWEKRDDVNYQVTVDNPGDNWHRHVGVITTLFPKITFDPERTIAVVVGPPVMYRFVALECIQRGIPESHIIMSLERRMKCGVGKCGHCQMNSKYVCQDGPVFTLTQLRSLHEGGVIGR